MTQSDVTHFSSPDPAKHARSVAQPSLQHIKGGCPTALNLALRSR